MAVYLMLILAVFASLFLKIDDRRQKQRWYIIIIFTSLTLIAMIRSWSVGVDTLQYYRNFSVIAQLDWKQIDLLRYEPGFFYFCKILSCLSTDPHILIAISSLIIIPSVGRFIYKYSSHMALSTYIYLTLNIYFFHLTGMRQSLAIAILLYGFDFLLKKKYIRYAGVVLLAALFHSSAALLLFLIFLQMLPYKMNTYFRTMGVAAIGFFLYSFLFQYIARFFTQYAGFTHSEFGFSNYFGTLLQFLLIFFLYTLAHYLHFHSDDLTKDHMVNDLCLRCLSVAVCVQAMAMRMNIIGRMSQYFLIFSIIAIPNMLYKFKEKNRFSWVLLTVTVLLAYWIIVGVLRPEWYGAIPYHTFMID